MHRPRLRAAWAAERTAGSDEAPAVVGVADLPRVREHAALLVEHQGIRVPPGPERVAGLQHLVGHVVAVALRLQPVLAEVLRLEVAPCGHDVPGGPTAAERIERADVARDGVGRHEAGREGDAQAEVPRHPRHHAAAASWGPAGRAGRRGPGSRRSCPCRGRECPGCRRRSRRRTAPPPWSWPVFSHRSGVRKSCAAAAGWRQRTRVAGRGTRHQVGDQVHLSACGQRVVLRLRPSSCGHRRPSANRQPS